MLDNTISVIFLYMYVWLYFCSSITNAPWALIYYIYQFCSYKRTPRTHRLNINIRTHTHIQIDTQNENSNLFVLLLLFILHCFALLLYFTRKTMTMTWYAKHKIVFYYYFLVYCFGTERIKKIPHYIFPFFS